MSRCHYCVNANLFIFMDCSQNRHRRRSSLLSLLLLLVLPIIDVYVAAILNFICTSSMFNATHESSNNEK